MQMSIFSCWWGSMRDTEGLTDSRGQSETCFEDVPRLLALSLTPWVSAITVAHQLLLPPECLLQADNILLPKGAQHLDLAQSRFANNLILCIFMACVVRLAHARGMRGATNRHGELDPPPCGTSPSDSLNFFTATWVSNVGRWSGSWSYDESRPSQAPGTHDFSRLLVSAFEHDAICSFAYYG